MVSALEVATYGNPNLFGPNLVYKGLLPTQHGESCDPLWAAELAPPSGT